MPKQKLPVWKHFSVVINNQNKKEYQCIYCKNKYTQNATRLTQHILKCARCPMGIKKTLDRNAGIGNRVDYDHDGDGSGSADVVASTSSQTSSRASSAGSMSLRDNDNRIDRFLDTTSVAEKKKLDTLLARAVYTSGSPLGITENPEWLNFLKALRPAYTPLTRHQLSHTFLNEEYENVRSEVLLKIANATTISLQCDGWSNIRFDLDQSTFSPTELDDSFMFYYRQPAKNDSKTMMDTKIVKSSTEPAVKVDFSNLSSTSSSDFSKPRPKGTDDGFKSEASQVGSSILRVASQIVSGKHPANTPEPADECEELLAKFDPYRRRGSRSLPASPLSSPKSKRKMNKFFTSPYVQVDKSKGWILSSLLAKRDISQSTSFIGEEEKEELERASSSISVDEVSTKLQKSQVYKAKPSELREMNFWSPTSM